MLHSSYGQDLSGYAQKASNETITGQWTFNAATTFSAAVTHNAHVLAGTAATYNLGAGGTEWANLFVNNVKNQSGDLHIQTTGVYDVKMGVNSGLHWEIDVNNADWRPINTNARDVGGTSNVVRAMYAYALYAPGAMTIRTTTASNLNLGVNGSNQWAIDSVAGDFIPSANNTKDIGGTSNHVAIVNAGIIKSGLSADFEIDVTTNYDINFSTNNIERWKILNSGGIQPSADSLYDIGATSWHVANVWADAFKSENALTIGTTTANDVSFIAGGTTYWILDESDGSFEPNTDSSYDIGSATKHCNSVRTNNVQSDTVLTVQTTGAADLRLGVNGSWQWEVDVSTGGILPSATNSWNLGSASKEIKNIYLVNAPVVSSDRRLKKNIRYLTPTQSLDKVLALRPVSYNYRYDFIGEPKRFGFIAQEAQEVLPEIIEENAETGRLHMKPTDIVPHLVASIHELQQQINQLKDSLCE